LNNIEKRLGILIGILRKKKLKAGDPAFKQQSFIESSVGFPFFGLKSGYSVCSLATLSRLENGKHAHDFALLDFFLKKLGIHYRIKESLLEKESNFLQKLSLCFTSQSKYELKKQAELCDHFYQSNLNDALIEVDYEAFTFVYNCMVNHPLSRKTYDQLVEQIEVFHPLIKDWLLGCGSLLRIIHPDFWTLPQTMTIPDFIQQLRIDHYLRQNNLFSNKTEASHLTNYHEDCLAVTVLNAFSFVSQNSDDPKGIFAEEMNLCIKLAVGIPNIKNGHSLLFEALKYFNSIQDSDLKLQYFNERLVGLLNHEPEPQRITKLLSQRILPICKETKTYKPLIQIVELLSENRKINRTSQPQES